MPQQAFTLPSFLLNCLNMERKENSYIAEYVLEMAFLVSSNGIYIFTSYMKL